MFCSYVNLVILQTDTNYETTQKMKLNTGAKEMYDQHAENWQRIEPIMLSDYSARPFVIDKCAPINNANVLDLGCGEGYVGRELLSRGAASVFGVDISDKMIQKAIQIKEELSLTNASYTAEDIRSFIENYSEKHNLIIAVFLFNYLTIEDTTAVMSKVHALLEDGGSFVFAVPHPSLPFLKKDKYPFYFDASGGYFSSKNKQFPGQIWRRDGIAVDVQCVHKTFEDYFKAIAKAGFKNIPDVEELKISEEHIKLDPDFFRPLYDIPLHVLFKLTK